MVDIGLAGPEDDAELRALLRGSAMPGAVRVSLRRDPCFFDSLSVTGSHHDVMVARDTRSRALVGCGVRSIASAYVNGERTSLGYLGGLRLLPAYRGGLALARGFRLLRELHADGRAALYLTTIVEANRSARRLLTSGRCGLPRYTDLGTFHSFAIASRRAPPESRDPDLRIRAAAAGDIPEIAAFLRAEGPRRQFFPDYSERDLRSETGRLRGLRIEDVLLAFRRGRLAGTLAVWDQTAFRQAWIDGYAPLLAAARPLYNLAARAAGRPLLPPAGTQLRAAHLALACVSGDAPSTFAALVAAALRRCRGTHPVLLAGLHDADPLLPVLRRLRGRAYPSALYAVRWEGSPPPPSPGGGRVPFLELGAL